MKCAKYLIMIIVLTLGFLFSGELYNAELWNIGDSYFLASQISYTNLEERQNLLSDLERAADEHNVGLFSVDFVKKSENSFDVNIYYNTKAETAVKNVYKEGTNDSLLSENLEISFMSFESVYMDDNIYVDTISFVGEDDNIYATYNELIQYDITFPDYLNSSDKDIIFVVWLVVSSILIVLCGIEVVFRKKEIVLRVSLGESVSKIIFKEILMDSLIECSLFVFVGKIIKSIYSSIYMEKQCLLIFLAGVVLSGIIKLSFAKYDIKKAFSNVKDSKGIVFICMGLKAITLMLTIIVLTVNTNLIIKNVNILSENEVVEEFDDYYYLDLEIKQSAESENSDELIKQIYEAIYVEHYSEVKPAVSVIALDDEEKQYIFVNENAHSIVKKFIGNVIIDKSKDFYIFVPQKYNGEETLQDAIYCMSEAVINMEELTYDVIEYKETRVLSIPDVQSSSGIIDVENPIVILSNYDYENNVENLCGYGDYSKDMFKITQEDLESLKKEYKLEEKGISASLSNVYSEYIYHKNKLLKETVLMGTLMGLLLAVELILIMLVNSMEYRLNAMELALKKVLGYSVIKKNIRIIATTLVSSFLAIIGVVITGTLTRSYSVKYCLASSVVLVTIEMIIIITNIEILEKKNIAKILKGGCL